jgi:hypothetical protein
MSDKKHNQSRFRNSVAGLSCFMLLPVMAVALVILRLEPLRVVSCQQN